MFAISIFRTLSSNMYSLDTCPTFNIKIVITRFKHKSQLHYTIKIDFLEINDTLYKKYCINDKQLQL